MINVQGILLELLAGPHAEKAIAFQEVERQFSRDPYVALRIRPPRRQVERFFGNGPALGGHIIFHNSDPLSDQGWFDPDVETG